VSLSPFFEWEQVNMFLTQMICRVCIYICFHNIDIKTKGFIPSIILI
jgi:hypothetical protein